MWLTNFSTRHGYGWKVKCCIKFDKYNWPYSSIRHDNDWMLLINYQEYWILFMLPVSLFSPVIRRNTFERESNTQYWIFSLKDFFSSHIFVRFSSHLFSLSLELVAIAANFQDGKNHQYFCIILLCFTDISSAWKCRTRGHTMWISAWTLRLSSAWGWYLQSSVLSDGESTVERHTTNW